MKTITAVIILVVCILFTVTSCMILVSKDNGRNKGWHKNSNNPHHPYSSNQGQSKGKSKN